MGNCCARCREELEGTGVSEGGSNIHSSRCSFVSVIVVGGGMGSSLVACAWEVDLRLSAVGISFASSYERREDTYCTTTEAAYPFAVDVDVLLDPHVVVVWVIIRDVHRVVRAASVFLVLLFRCVFVSAPFVFGGGWHSHCQSQLSCSQSRKNVPCAHPPRHPAPP